jgi:hypothetical protein
MLVDNLPHHCNRYELLQVPFWDRIPCNSKQCWCSLLAHGPKKQLLPQQGWHFWHCLLVCLNCGVLSSRRTDHCRFFFKTNPGVTSLWAKRPCMTGTSLSSGINAKQIASAEEKRTHTHLCFFGGKHVSHRPRGASKQSSRRSFIKL